MTDRIQALQRMSEILNSIRSGKDLRAMYSELKTLNESLDIIDTFKLIDLANDTAIYNLNQTPETRQRRIRELQTLLIYYRRVVQKALSNSGVAYGTPRSKDYLMFSLKSVLRSISDRYNNRKLAITEPPVTSLITSLERAKNQLVTQYGETSETAAIGEYLNRAITALTKQTRARSPEAQKKMLKVASQEVLTAIQEIKTM